MKKKKGKRKKHTQTRKNNPQKTPQAKQNQKYCLYVRMFPTDIN